MTLISFWALPISCAFQEDVNHTRSFSHLCERLPESEFTDSTQPTPTQETPLDAGTAQSPDALLRLAVLYSGPAFNLSPLTMEDLRWQDSHYSRANAVSRVDAGATVNLAVDADGYPYASGGEDSDDEYGSREVTPASEIYREMGMESKAVQTDSSDGSEPTEVLGAAQSSNERYNTSVGRTVVDFEGEPMELDEDSPGTEEALLLEESADLTPDGSIIRATARSKINNGTFGLPVSKYTPSHLNAPSLSENNADTSVLPTTVSNTAESSSAVPDDATSSTGSRSVFGFESFRFSSPQRYARLRPTRNSNNSVLPSTILDTVDPSSSGNREIASHESIVEDLIVPPPGRSSASSSLSTRERAAETGQNAAIVPPGRTSGMAFQPHLQQARSQLESVDSPRSSPEPEAIMI